MPRRIELRATILRIASPRLVLWRDHLYHFFLFWVLGHGLIGSEASIFGELDTFIHHFTIGAGSSRKKKSHCAKLSYWMCNFCTPLVERSVATMAIYYRLHMYIDRLEYNVKNIQSRLYSPPPTTPKEYVNLLCSFQQSPTPRSHYMHIAETISRGPLSLTLSFRHNPIHSIGPCLVCPSKPAPRHPFRPNPTKKGGAS